MLEATVVPLWVRGHHFELFAIDQHLASKSDFLLLQRLFLSTMTYQKLNLFQAHYGRHANAIQSLQLSLPLSVIIIYLAAQQYSCVTQYINCTTLRMPPRESLFVPSTPDLMPEKFFWIHSPHIKAISASSPVTIYSAAVYWTAEHCTEQAGGCVLDEDLSFFIIFYSF